jgi:hypothetical protein
MLALASEAGLALRDAPEMLECFCIPLVSVGSRLFDRLQLCVGLRGHVVRVGIVALVVRAAIVALALCRRVCDAAMLHFFIRPIRVLRSDALCRHVVCAAIVALVVCVALRHRVADADMLHCFLKPIRVLRSDAIGVLRYKSYFLIKVDIFSPKGLLSLKH